MIKLYPLTSTDYEDIDRLWKLYWSDKSLPPASRAIVNAVAKDEDGRIIAYGTVHHFAEAMLCIDPTARYRDRALATKLLMFEAYRGTEKAGLKELYSFISDPDFALLIEKHFGFLRVIDPGEVLVKEFR